MSLTYFADFISADEWKFRMEFHYENPPNDGCRVLEFRPLGSCDTVNPAIL